VGGLWCSFCPSSWSGARFVSSGWPRGGAAVWPGAGRLAPGNNRCLGRSRPSRWFCGDPALEELADLEHTAWLSSCLLLLITAGSCLESAAAPSRSVSGALSLPGGGITACSPALDPELRAEQGLASGSFSTYACFKGGPAMGRAWPPAGCPLAPPAHLEDNTQLRALPHLRPGPAASSCN